MEKKEIKDLEVGDIVIVHTPYHNRIAKVDKVTLQHIIVDGTKYLKKDGYLSNGDVWCTTRITVPSAEDCKRVLVHNEKKRLIASLKATDYYLLSIDQLRKIYKILNEQDNSKVQLHEQEANL